MSVSPPIEPLTAPLRAEHRELLSHIDALRTTAAAVGATTPADLRTRVDASHSLLAEHLLKHASAEDAALYPVVNRLLGNVPVTATMSRDHVEVAALTAELGGLRERLATEPPGDELAEQLRRVLYGLYALVKLHFPKEEEIYLPLLDARLSSEEAAAMFDALDSAAPAGPAR